jgi:hypothetical protein
MARNAGMVPSDEPPYLSRHFPVFRKRLWKTVKP